ncbi:MAG TPA: hypothetical protein VJ754_11645 [Anaerolineae bacterium]|nr:hypothetical protein [Anaerolineae bacterium]
MRRNPERLAWSVLFVSFGICVCLAIAVPLGIRSFVADSTDAANLILDVPQGTAFLRRPNSTDTVAVINQTTGLLEGSEIIIIDQPAQAALTMRDPDSGGSLVTVQLSDISNLTIVTARSPRFQASPRPHQLNLFITGGRVRINVLSNNRPVTLSIQSPQGEAHLGVGTYVVEVTNSDLQVTVREGEATVSAQGTSVLIEPSQSARVPLGQPPQGGLAGERNLVADGSFADVIQPEWTIEHGPQNESEPKGGVVTAIVGGRRAARFERVGRGHAETRLTQPIDRDVTESVSLKLHFAVQVNQQDVPVCGSLGSECPMMVRISYRDASGTPREWIQGFYSAPDPNGVNPRFCVTCATRNLHQSIPPNTWFTYDSGNLMDSLSVDGEKPARIMLITFYASGHSYRSAITDVELLVQD